MRFEPRPLGPFETEVTVTLHLKHGAALRTLEPFAWGLMRPALVRTVAALERLDATAVDGESG